jgi:DNA-binding NarL/FixJ family response regulator
MESEDIMGSKIRVLVIDGSFIHTQLLSDALKRDEGLDVSSSNSADAALNSALERSFDVLLISATLDEQPYRGLKVLRELRTSRPNARAIILLDSSKSDGVVDALRAGAKGVFSRHESLDSLCKCIRCVHNGQIWANSQEMSLALEALACAPTLHAADANGLNLLSKRETEIVQCVAEGLTNREIAERLQLSRHTIKNSLFRIFDKLGVSNRLELLLMTLSRDSHPQSLLASLLKSSKTGVLQDHCNFEECVQAAEEGSLVAQLLLAQLYSTRASTKDILLAYKWYLIASTQTSTAVENVKKMINAEQLRQVEEKAIQWLTRSRKTPSAGTASARESAA